MKKLLICLITLGSVCASGNVISNGSLESLSFNQEMEGKEDYLKQINKMYKEGVQPKPEEVLNTLWSGRCFNLSEPSVAIGYSLHLKPRHNRALGPLGQTYEVVDYSGDYPDFFDTMELEDFLPQAKAADYVPVTFSNGHIQVHHGLEGYTQKLKMDVSGKYLVERSVQTATTNRNAGEWRCYYFRVDTQK